MSRLCAGQGVADFHAAALCREERDALRGVFSKSALSALDSKRSQQRHEVMCAKTWQQQQELFNCSLGIDLYATSTALMLHQLARFREQNMKRKRKSQDTKEQLHAPRGFITK